MPSLHPSPEVALSKKLASVPFLSAAAPPAAPWYPGGVLLAASSLPLSLAQSERSRKGLSSPPLSLSSRRGDLQRRHGLLALLTRCPRARKHALSLVVTRNLTTKSLLARTLTSDALLSDDHSLVLFAAFSVPLARFVHTCAMLLRGRPPFSSLRIHATKIRGPDDADAAVACCILQHYQTERGRC